MGPPHHNRAAYCFDQPPTPNAAHFKKTGPFRDTVQLNEHGILGVKRLQLYMRHFGITLMKLCMFTNGRGIQDLTEVVRYHPESWQYLMFH